MLKELFERLFNIELRTFNLCNNIQGFERWFGSYNNRIDINSIYPINISSEWSEIIGEKDLNCEDFKYYDIRKIKVGGVTGNTRVQFRTNEGEIFESLVSENGFYIIDVEPLKRGTTLESRYIGKCMDANLELFISIIRI